MESSHSYNRYETQPRARLPANNAATDPSCQQSKTAEILRPLIITQPCDPVEPCSRGFADYSTITVDLSSNQCPNEQLQLFKSYHTSGPRDVQFANLGLTINPVTTQNTRLEKISHLLGNVAYKLEAHRICARLNQVASFLAARRHWTWFGRWCGPSDEILRCRNSIRTPQLASIPGRRVLITYGDDVPLSYAFHALLHDANSLRDWGLAAPDNIGSAVLMLLKLWLSALQPH